MTLRYSMQQLAPFLQPWQAQGVIHVGERMADPIRAYRVILQERGVKANTVHAAARAVRAFSNFLVIEALITIRPMRKVRMPRLPKEIPPAFSPEDVRRLVGVCTTTRDEAIVLFLMDSGCLASELVALNVGDVDVRSGEVRMRRGKGGKDRITYVGLQTRKIMGHSDLQILKRYLALVNDDLMQVHRQHGAVHNLYTIGCAGILPDITPERVRTDL